MRVELSPPDALDVAALADQWGVTRSAVVRAAVRLLLDSDIDLSPTAGMAAEARGADHRRTADQIAPLTPLENLP